MDDKTTVIKAYKRYAKNYDRIFGKIFEHGRRVLVDKMRAEAGQRLLEVGVGTGLSLPLYPEGVSVVGIDISPHMLWLAKNYIHDGGADGTRHLSLMDAQQMSFADNSFDKVALMYVVTVVPRPDLMMAEVARVCRPGGDIFVLNHFSNHRLIPRMVEKAMLPFRNLLGFSPRFSMEAFLEENPLQVVDTCQVNLMGYWTLIHARNI
ncbi:MAG: methyltransferase domain-containing protein [Desulfobacteraceae bacterium]|nr:methyltransferase domain-containing protein [Desulfobacteraceae bacterium]